MRWHEKTWQGTRRQGKARKDIKRHGKEQDGTGTRARGHGMFPILVYSLSLSKTQRGCVYCILHFTTQKIYSVTTYRVNV